ncbi:phospholipase D family protein [Paenibacillus sp. J2TS4]|uniref:phospholipase D family nuclease n=1 Tax=Paenibacillus sp. J2TS4 TaxID=2807194 RepID=UPI001B1274D3|nr:phospholipase D family protein [Paenibacillus sp. J2TS4]GIP32648.1 hypothetical protein J2TS4_18580 [Paenibacillus sp. J2TS4]
MKLFKVLCSTVWIALLVGCSAIANSDAAPSFSNNEAKIEWAFTQENQHPEKLLVEVIESATDSLDIAIYSLTHPEIVQAIKEAQKRGVAVRVITDKIQSGGKSQNEALKIVGSAGVPLKVNSHSGLMHHKMTIVDKKVVTTGSYNYSKAASTRNDEILMVIRDEEIAQSFADEFEKMWNDSSRFDTVEKRIAMEEEPENNTNSKKPANSETENTNKKVAANLPVPAAPSENCEDPLIKGNKNSMVYHVPGGQSYEKTNANVEMFCTTEEAEAAGYRAAKQ